MRTTIDQATKEKIRQAYVPGVFGHKSLAALFGVSKTSVRRILDPEVEERMRRQSRTNKRKRHGRCLDCGAVTRYAGNRGNAVSPRCGSCARIASGLAQRGTGPMQTRLHALLVEPRRFSEIALVLGITEGHTGVLLHRELKAGRVTRLRRGWYGLP